MSRGRWWGSVGQLYHPENLDCFPKGLVASRGPEVKQLLSGRSGLVFEASLGRLLSNAIDQMYFALGS